MVTQSTVTQAQYAAPRQPLRRVYADHREPCRLLVRPTALFLRMTGSSSTANSNVDSDLLERCLALHPASFRRRR